MIALILFVGLIVVLGLLHVADKKIEKAKERKSIAAHAARDEFDEDGHKKFWDAHYTRGIELEQGITVALTQCDDVHCKTCYWKPGALEMFDTVDFPNGSLLLEKRQEFIKSLPDDMSNELCEFMYADWLEEMADDIRADKEVRAAKAEVRRREELEKKYATPYYLIELYQKEGRTFDPISNTWSFPKAKANNNTATSVVPVMVEPAIWNGAFTTNRIEPDDIVDLETEDYYDPRDGQRYQYTYAKTKSGKKYGKKMPYKNKGYDW